MIIKEPHGQECDSELIIFKPKLYLALPCAIPQIPGTHMSNCTLNHVITHIPIPVQFQHAVNFHGKL